MIRLLIFLSSTAAGGAERMTITLANHLVGRVDVHLVFGRSGILSAQISPAVFAHHLRASRGRQALLPLARVMRRIRPDVVFATKPDAAIVAAVAWRLAGRPGSLVLRESNHRTAQGIPVRSAFTRALRWAYDQAAVVVAPSRGIADDLIRRYDISRRRLVNIDNPVDLARIRSQATLPFTNTAVEPHALQIRGLGRLVHQKGFDLLLAAVKRAQQASATRLELHIGGDGPDRRVLECLASDLQLDPDVRFVGVQHNPYAYLRHADVFVLSSRWEGFPNALVEAMALGVPVVALRTPGADEIVVHEESGLLCDAESPGALSDAILRLADDSELRARCGAAGAAAVARFDAPDIADQYRTLFTKVSGARSNSAVI